MFPKLSLEPGGFVKLDNGEFLKWYWRKNQFQYKMCWILSWTIFIPMLSSFIQGLQHLFIFDPFLVSPPFPSMEGPPLHFSESKGGNDGNRE